MDNGTFTSYKFKPSDVIEGLNRYFAETKANRYLRVPLEIKNGEVKPGNYYVIRNIVFDVSTPKIKECGYYYLICDPEEVVGVAINWLREEHDIFYTPGMNEPPIKDPDDIDDFCVDDAAKAYEKATRKNRIEELQESRRDLIEALQRRLYEAKRRIVALEEGHKEKSKIIDRLREKTAEQQKKIDSYESTLSKITDIMEPKYAGPAWSETWDDLVERIKRLKTEHDDVRGLSLKIEELEEDLKHAAGVEVWYRRTNRELVMERDHYKDICEEQERDLQEWKDRFDKICEELDTDPEEDFDDMIDELRKNLNELDKLAEFKAKLAEVIKLPEDKKRTATTEDYISSFEHTKKEWRKMEIKLENYERENKLLLERNHVLSTSNGAIYVLRNLHDSIVGLPYDFDDPPQILGVRIIDKFNHNRTNGCRYLKRMRELEHKLEDIKDICNGNSDVMNIIG